MKQISVQYLKPLKGYKRFHMRRFMFQIYVIYYYEFSYMLYFNYYYFNNWQRIVKIQHRNVCKTLKYDYHLYEYSRFTELLSIFSSVNFSLV